MATHASAEKATRQALRRGARNLSVRSHCKTVVGKLRAALVAKAENKEEAKKRLDSLFNDAQRVLRKAASKKVIKIQTASRQISRLSLAIHRYMTA